MGPRVAVVTDSTACLPADLVAASGVQVVPLQVVMDGRSRAEGVEVTPGEVAEALRAMRTVTTSRPGPETFAERYRQILADGAQAVLSVHLSGELSGTVDAARTAAAEVGTADRPVRVVDSRSLGMGLGYAVLAAADVLAAGGDLERAAETAARVGMSAAGYFYVDTLEYLRRGGRISGAQAALGSALSVKPLLQLVDGRLERLDRVRTASKALARLEEIVQTEVAGRPVDLAVHHLAAPNTAERLAAHLRDRLPDVRRLVVNEVGAAVGAHVGPGMIAVVICPVG